MKWDQLLCEMRKQSNPNKKNSYDMRNEFQRDYHRIICSASFRRLQDKTQVFPLDKSDFVRTRLTHSLEVSSFAKSLGQMAFQNIIDNGIDSTVTPDVKEKICSILECAGLLHDIGNPPFGHFGEASIRNWFADNLSKLEFEGKSLDSILDEQMKNDLCNFEGNAQALRLLSKLHYLVDENGMHLTYALLNTLIKYPVSSCEIDKKHENIIYHKMGYYLAEQQLFEEITANTGAVGCRYPLTFLLEAADDIAYVTADIEDAVKKGLVSYDCLKRTLDESPAGSIFIDKDRNITIAGSLKYRLEQALKMNISDPEINAVQNWVIGIQGMLLRSVTKAFTDNYTKIMNGEFSSELLAVSDVKEIKKAISSLEVKYVYNAREIITSEVAAGNMIYFLMDNFVPAAIKSNDESKLTEREKRLINIISDNYRQIYRIYSHERSEEYQLYLRLLLVTDFICGMTDSYAKRMYQLLSGIE